LLRVAVVAVAAGCGSTPAPSAAVIEPAGTSGASPDAAVAPVLESPPVPAELEPILEPEQYLADGYWSRFPRRARVGAWGEIRLTRDGPSVATGEPWNQSPGWKRHVVVVDHGERVRIIENNTWWRMLLWVNRTDLSRVPVTRALLDVELGVRPAGNSGVTVMPGLLLTYGDERDGAIETGWRDWEFHFLGWVPEEQLGHVFTPESAPPKGQRTHRISKYAAMYDVPGGVAFAEFFVDAHAVPLVEVVGEQDDYTEVVYHAHSDEFVARGFVESDAVTLLGELPGYGTGSGRSGAKPIADRTRVTLTPGTCLFDAERVAVGVVDKVLDGYAAAAANTKLWYVAIETSWGLVDVHVAPTSSADELAWVSCADEWGE
jgi:hypothetical protein